MHEEEARTAQTGEAGSEDVRMEDGGWSRSERKQGLRFYLSVAHRATTYLAANP